MIWILCGIIVLLTIALLVLLDELHKNEEGQ